MIRYTVFFNGSQVDVYDLDEPVVFIGRLPENQIPITNMGISRRHVKIELDPSGQHTLLDLNSLNGTILNGVRVKSATLTNGDRITVGKYTIVYEDLREASPYLDTMVAEVSPEELRRMVAATDRRSPPAPVTPLVPPPVPAAPAPVAPAPQAQVPAPAPAADAHAGGCAVLIETVSHVVYKLDRPLLTIGSHEEDDIYAVGFMMGRAAATVEHRHNGSYYISAKKMKINGKAAKSQKLEHRDRIEIGASIYRFMENG